MPIYSAYTLRACPDGQGGAYHGPSGILTQGVIWPCPPVRTSGLLISNLLPKKCLLMSLFFPDKYPRRGEGPLFCAWVKGGVTATPQLCLNPFIQSFLVSPMAQPFPRDTKEREAWIQSSLHHVKVTQRTRVAETSGAWILSSEKWDNNSYVTGFFQTLHGVRFVKHKVRI